MFTVTYSDGEETLTEDVPSLSSVKAIANRLGLRSSDWQELNEFYGYAEYEDKFIEYEGSAA